MSPSLRLLELVIIFLALPLAFRFSPIAVPPLPLLWLVTLYCFFILRSDPSFSRARLWNAAAIPASLPSVLLLFALCGGLIFLGTRLFAPRLLFIFIRKRPMLWGAVMILYPTLSVYPQGIVYRAFFLHRYAPLFHSDIALIIASAVAFGFLHIIFRNPLAVILTFFGGLLFAWRYQHTGSLAVSSLEHALYGCLLFTVGLGDYFYHARTRLLK